MPVRFAVCLAFVAVAVGVGSAAASASLSLVRPIRDIPEVVRAPHAWNVTAVDRVATRSRDTAESRDNALFVEELLTTHGESLARACIAGALDAVANVIGGAITTPVSFWSGLHAGIKGCLEH